MIEMYGNLWSICLLNILNFILVTRNRLRLLRNAKYDKLCRVKLPRVIKLDKVALMKTRTVPLRRALSERHIAQNSPPKLIRSKSTFDLSKVRSILKTPADKPASIFARRKSVTFSDPTGTSTTSKSGVETVRNDSKQKENSHQGGTHPKVPSHSVTALASTSHNARQHNIANATIPISSQPSKSTTIDKKPTVVQMVIQLNQNYNIDINNKQSSIAFQILNRVNKRPVPGLIPMKPDNSSSDQHFGPLHYDLVSESESESE